jgi:hypothetical protein
MNPLLEVTRLGQSLWLDSLRRGQILSGELGRLVEEDGLSGETVNPTIFEKAIAGSADYDEAITRLAAEGRSAAEIYEALAIEDIRLAADVFRPVYERTNGRVDRQGGQGPHPGGGRAAGRTGGLRPQEAGDGRDHDSLLRYRGVLMTGGWEKARILPRGCPRGFAQGLRDDPRRAGEARAGNG